MFVVRASEVWQRRSLFPFAAVVLVLVLSSFSFCSARTGFVKDQNEDLIKFPPKITPMLDPAIPVGHLRPLGWQRMPSGEVAQLFSMIGPQEFQKKFVSLKKPVVFRKVIQDIPAMKNWNKKNYLKDTYGNLDVHVAVKKEVLTSGPKKMPFKKFLKEFNYEDWYLSNFVPLEMMKELVLPSCLKCGFRRWLMESEIWMSSGGTCSLLHSHADHDLHCVLSGRKDFILVDPKYKTSLSYHDKPPYVGSGYSDLDTDRINMFKHKSVADVPWIWSTLRAGDCIFVPAGHLHQVRSFGRSISSTNHFSPSPDIVFDECEKVKLNEVLPLSEAGFLWTYSDGKLLLSNSRLSAPSMKHHLLMVMRAEEELTFELFDAFHGETMQEAKDFPDSKASWRLIAPDNKTSLSRTEVKELPDEALQKLADIFNIPHRQIAKKPKKDEL